MRMFWHRSTCFQLTSHEWIRKSVASMWTGKKVIVWLQHLIRFIIFQPFQLFCVLQNKGPWKLQISEINIEYCVNTCFSRWWEGKNTVEKVFLLLSLWFQCRKASLVIGQRRIFSQHFFKRRRKNFRWMIAWHIGIRFQSNRTFAYVTSRRISF